MKRFSITGFYSDTKGFVFALVAGGILTLILAVGVAVDISSYTRTKTQFRNAIDQALLATAASAVKDPGAMQAYAMEYFNANFTKTIGDAKLDTIAISYDPTKVEWTATAQGSFTPSVASLIGIQSFHLNHIAKVTWDEISTEVVFAVDMSASMCATFESAAREKGVLKVQPDASCSKLNAVKDALRYLIEGDNTGETTWTGLPSGTTTDGRARFKIGIVPFTHKVKFPDVNNLPSVLTESEISQGDPNYFKLFNVDPGAAETAQYPLPVLTPLVELTGTANRDALVKQIDAIKTSYDVPGWTRSNLGLMTAGLMLDPVYQSSFGGARPAEPGQRLNEKVIFLLTDGANMGCCFSDHPTGTFEHQYLYTYRTDNAHMSGEGGASPGLCQSLKDQGVTLYTIVYDVQDADANGGGAEIKKILKNCASGDGEEGLYYFDLQLNEGAKIKESYQQIAKSLMRLRLSY